MIHEKSIVDKNEWDINDAWESLFKVVNRIDDWLDTEEELLSLARSDLKTSEQERNLPECWNVWCKKWIALLEERLICRAIKPAKKNKINKERNLCEFFFIIVWLTRTL